MSGVGLVGGLGPESTIDYYRRLLASWQRIDPGSAPSIVIDSLDAQRALVLVSTDRAALVEYLLASPSSEPASPWTHPFTRRSSLASAW